MTIFVLSLWFDFRIIAANTLSETKRSRSSKQKLIFLRETKKELLIQPRLRCLRSDVGRIRIDGNWPLS